MIGRAELLCVKIRENPTCGFPSFPSFDGKFTLSGALNDKVISPSAEGDEATRLDCAAFSKRRAKTFERGGRKLLIGAGENF